MSINLRPIVFLVTMTGLSIAFLDDPDDASGQVPPVRDHIYLPPTRGATVLSTYIDAQARYVAAVGDYLESAAIARRHRAEAASREMDNAVKWVDTFFQRRELNRNYRQKEDPPYLDKEQKREDVARRRIIELPQLVREGNVTDELNWLLDQIATAPQAYEYVYGSNSFYAGSPTDQTLPPDKVRHVILSDGGRLYGEKLTFRATDGEVLAERWPRLLRAPEFDAERKAFEELRDLAMKEVLDKNELSYRTFENLLRAINTLSRKLESEYPRKKRQETSKLFLEYNCARHFLKHLELSVYRAMNTSDMGVFSGDYQFKGHTVFELVKHMSQNGLRFANWVPGGEGIYERLLAGMRQIYLEFYPQ